MSPHPLDRASRRALRDERRRSILADAERDAALSGLSLNCRDRKTHGTHPVNGPGCTNDGTGCLCACHDQTGDGR